MQCYTELAPPTAVSHAVQLPFISPKSNNLVVAKVSLLQIFEFKSTVTEVNSGANDASNNAISTHDSEAADVAIQRTEHTSKLVLVAEYPLQGTVTALARIKTLDTPSGGEALLISFRDAKLSLVEWDPELHTLATRSIHYYEGPNVAGAPWEPPLKDCHNFLTADPRSRCAAFKFGAHKLAILPFRQLNDDLVEEDYDPEIDGEREEPQAKGDASNGADGDDAHKTPYLPSFVLPLTALDPTLTHPIHLAFLHEYREPTFGVISSAKVPAASLLLERKDVLTYKVFTLDLEQKASTTLLSVSGIPYDVTKVVPLPLPIGGALLLGGNELIHVDQGGKTNGIAVNEFAKLCTSFPLTDQSDLGVRLEHCTAELLSPETGDVLIIPNTGELLILSFTLDGRTVSGLTLERVAEERGGRLLNSRTSCAINLGRGRLFVGSKDGESALLGWSSKTNQLSRKRSHAEMLVDDDMSLDEEDIDDLDDDLYDDSVSPTKPTAAATAGTKAPGSYVFRIHDSLPSLAPTRDVAFGTLGAFKALKEPKGPTTQNISNVDIVASTGRGRGAGLTLLKRDIEPKVLKESTLQSTRGLWSIHAKKPSPKGVVTDSMGDMERNLSADVEYDQYLVVCKVAESGNEETVVYEVKGTNIEQTSKGDFEREDGSTLNVGILVNGTKIVQVLRSEVRTYDSELSLDQILPMEDEDSGAELRIIASSFADPYLLVLRDDSSVRIFKATESGEVEEIENEGLSNGQWMSGCLYATSGGDTLAVLLTPEGGLQIFSIPDLEKPSYVAEGLPFLPPFLTAAYVPRRSSAKATLTEILVADIGDVTSKSPHLLIRTAADDLYIYQPFHYPPRSGSDPFTTNLRWLKLPQMHLPRYTEEPALESDDGGEQSTLIPVQDIGGYSTVFQRGTSPCFILKEASSTPKVISLSYKAVKGLTSFHTAACERGFAHVDADDTLRICQLPENVRYGDLGWVSRKIPLGGDVDAFAYHPKGVYVVGTGELVDFTLPEDNYHTEWAREDTKFRPRVTQGIVKLLYPGNWSVIDTQILDPYEVVLCMKTLELEVSENTHERKPLIAVGTSIIQGEDLATKGRIYIYEVITVVPEPGRPETNRKLRLVAKEEVKGAVSAVSSIGHQGFLIMAQGQKCMVRGLKEDGTLLPVAFLDMQIYVSILKELKGTGMVLMGDMFKGLWFTGYTEEPYKLMLFGKGRTNMEVLAADFLPFDKQLHFIVADADNNFHVLQYDPDHPKSLSGQRLLHKSTFHTGHFPTGLHLLRSSLSWASTGDLNPSLGMDGDPDTTDMAPQPLYQLLHTTQSGSIALLTPLPEETYRRLSALATFLANVLESPCGLNQRGYRAVENEGFGSRGIVDGGLLRRIGELGVQRRKEALLKVGMEEWVLRSDLEVLTGAGTLEGA